MIDVRASTVIERQLHEVFEFMGSLENLPLWLEGCRKAWPVSGDPTQPGSTVAHLDEFMGRSFESHFRVLEWEPNSRMVFETISGPLRGRSEQIFDEQNGTTRVEISVSGEVVGLFRGAGWMVRRAASRQLEASLENLRKVLEKGDFRNGSRTVTG